MPAFSIYTYCFVRSVKVHGACIGHVKSSNHFVYAGIIDRVSPVMTRVPAKNYSTVQRNPTRFQLKLTAEGKRIPLSDITTYTYKSSVVKKSKRDWCRLYYVLQLLRFS